MNPWLRLTLIVLLSVQTLSCGSKKPSPAEPGGGETEGEADEEKQKQQAVKEAQTRIKDWLGKDLAEHVSKVGKEVGKDVGLKLAADKEVLDKAGALTKKIFKDDQVRFAVCRGVHVVVGPRDIDGESALGDESDGIGANGIVVIVVQSNVDTHLGDAAVKGICAERLPAALVC